MVHAHKINGMLQPRRKTESRRFWVGRDLFMCSSVFKDGRDSSQFGGWKVGVKGDWAKTGWACGRRLTKGQWWGRFWTFRIWPDSELNGDEKTKVARRGQITRSTVLVQRLWTQNWRTRKGGSSRDWRTRQRAASGPARVMLFSVPEPRALPWGSRRPNNAAAG